MSNETVDFMVVIGLPLLFVLSIALAVVTTK